MSPNDTSDFGLGDADTETKAFSKDTSGGPVMEEWQRIAKRKQDERESRILRYCQFRGWDFPANAIPSPDVLDVSEYPLKTLTALERQIVEWDATEIVQKTTGEDDNERVTALQVFDAFSKAAIAAQQVTNCLTEVFFEEGYERAKELDEHFKKHGKGVGPLHGVPFSIKDHIMVKGQDTASGYIYYVGKIIPEEDCLPVAILRNAGAIIYVKTANPQGLMVCWSYPS
jgi:amidase